ncbi:MAG TPA: sodium:calcium antiporter [Patescibacteria group bacterium]|nr:sodium:calcium antiporter [Patescibacteria group bacterium]
MFFTFLATVLALGVILLACDVFTNGIEWLGKKWNLSHGAVGSILAAIGTALPETLLPVIAVFTASNQDAGHKIGVGAIIGAPLMLTTLAMFVCGLAVVYFSRKKIRQPYISIDSAHMRRDFAFFIGAFLVAVCASFLPVVWMKWAVVALLVLIYAIYVFKTLGHPGEVSEDLSPLYIAKKNGSPSSALIGIQIFLALAVIILGAKLFVGQVESLSDFFQISSLILAMIIAPVATELPEKFNSIIWMKSSKDTLALGNISGALVFQASIVPSMGIIFTPWILGRIEFFTVFLTLTAATLLYLFFRTRSQISPRMLIGIGGGGYALFLLGVLFFPHLLIGV